ELGGAGATRACARLLSERRASPGRGDAAVVRSHDRASPRLAARPARTYHRVLTATPTPNPPPPPPPPRGRGADRVCRLRQFHFNDLLLAYRRPLAPDGERYLTRRLL